MTGKRATNRRPWSAPASWDEVCRRAAGRRSYNKARRLRLMVRRYRLIRLLHGVQGSMTTRGTQARLARELGVSRSTVCRDLAYLLGLGRPCPCCGAMRMTPPDPGPGEP